MQKNTSILVITVVLLFVGLAIVLLVWRSGGGVPYNAPTGNQPVTPAPAPQDTSAAISEDLKGVVVEDPNKEFTDIDTDLNNL